MSATLGDLKLASQFLRPGDTEGAETIESSAAGQKLDLIVKGYTAPAFVQEETDCAEQESDIGIAHVAIARDMFKVLRGSKNLVFANSRTKVEAITDRLVRLCEAGALPVEFYAHHGSLSKSLREDVETILK